MRRTKNVSERWQELRETAVDIARQRGLIYRECEPMLWGDGAICSIVSSRRQLCAILHPDGELRINFKALPSKIDLVCNILDFDQEELWKLFAQYP
jgi:hypothetical protein